MLERTWLSTYQARGPLEEYWLMFRFTAPAPRALAVTAAIFLATVAASAQLAPRGAAAPVQGRSRRINANRRARIQRNIEDAYSHKWEVGGGIGFLRYRTGPNQQRTSEV